MRWDMRIDSACVIAVVGKETDLWGGACDCGVKFLV
jgi:hypothetical protein